MAPRAIPIAPGEPLVLSWLIVFCLLAIVLCPAVPPSAVVAAVAAVPAVGVILYPPAPTARAEDEGWHEDADRRGATGLPEDPDQGDYAEVVGCTGCSGRTGCEGCGGGSGFAGCAG